MTYGPTTPQEVRRVFHGRVWAPTRELWECDPQALPGRDRYRLINQDGSYKEVFAYWELITPLDDARTRYHKWRKSRELEELTQEISRKQSELRRRQIYG